MSENTKRTLSFLVAFSLLFSMLPMGVGAQEQQTAEQLIPETMETATVEPVTEPAEAVTETVPETVPQTVPEETTAPEAGELPPVEEDSSHEKKDVRAGAEDSLVVSLVMSPVTVMEGTCGGLASEYDYVNQTQLSLYWHYSTWELMQKSTFTATFRDGTVITGSGTELEYNGSRYFLDYMDTQNYSSRWVSGNTYYIDVELLGAQTQLEVTITESPVVSWSVAPISVPEFSRGYEEGGNYHYSLWNLLSNSTYTVNMADGSVLTGTGSNVEYAGEYFSIVFSDPQNSANVWTVGNTYYVDVVLMGKFAQLEVTIVEPPLVSLSFTPVSVVQGASGYISNEYNPDTGHYDLEYYRYSIWELLSKSTYTATFNDGTVLTGNGSGVDYDGNWYEFAYSDPQSYQNQWAVDRTYTVDITCMGQSTQLQVTVESTPISRVDFAPIEIIEGTCGTLSENHPEDGSVQTYYYYYWHNRLSYTIYFKNGETRTGTGTGYWDADTWVGFSTTDDQSYSNQWTAGNTYNPQVSVLGYTATVPVTITKTPVSRIEFEPIRIVEENGGDRVEHYPGDGTVQSYYSYNWWNKLSYTIYLQNGEEVTGRGTGFWYDNNWLNLSTSDNQSYSNQWTVGNTYTPQVSVMGYTTTVPVTIVESPVASVTFEPVMLREHEDGYWSWSDGGSYFRYSWSYEITYTITFKDGTVKRASGWESVFYDGESYSIGSYSDGQSHEEPWLLGNTYEAEVHFMGKEYPVYVTICDATEDNGFEYMVQNDQAIIIGCTMETEILEIPETIDGYTVVGVTSLGDALLHALELRIPDSVTMLSGDLLTTRYFGRLLPLQKMTLGSGVAHFDQGWAFALESIEVSADNPWLCSIDGVVYDKALTTMLAYPFANQTLHVVPDSVTNVDVLFENEELWNYPELAQLHVQFGAGVENYKLVDGVIYSADMTELVRVTPAATGSYVMPETVESIRGFAFTDSNLTAVTLSPNVTAITYTAFHCSTKLQQITLTGGLQYIGGGFENCDNLERINISDMAHWCNIQGAGNLLTYAKNLYLNGQLVKDLVIPDVVTTIYWEAFRGGNFESVTIPSSVREIQDWAFDGCENLKKVYITDLAAWCSIEFYDAAANPLYYAKDLYLNGQLVKDLVLPETVAQSVYSHRGVGVSHFAFVNGSFETVTVPAEIEYMGFAAFGGCENLKKVYITDLAAWCSICFEDEIANPLNCAEDLYLNGQLVQKLQIPSTVKVVYGCTFTGGSMTELTLPESVHTIETGAFAHSSLEKISFAEGLKTIGAGAFINVPVKTLALPDSLVEIHDGAFADCLDLESVSFGSKLEAILYNAFYNTGLKSVSLPDSLTYVGGEVFAECAALEQVSIGNGLTGIPYRMFYHSGLKSITLPKQVEFVDGEAFAESALTDVKFDCDEVSILWNAFENCPLNDLILGDNIVYIEENAFTGTNATQLRVPGTVTYISYRTFAFNENLVSVVIPDAVTYIDPEAFAGDNNLRHVLFTGTQEQWENMDCGSRELLSATVHCKAIGNEITTEQTCTTVRMFCSICDKWETVRKANANHTFENGVCTVCGHVGYWEYEVDEKAGTVTIVDYTGKEYDVVMPEKLEGLPVTGFTRETFAFNRRINSVELPATITTIPEDAFRYCSSLYSVTINGAVTKISDSAFLGCKNLQIVQLPDTLTEIGNSAFQGCADLRQIQLPTSVTKIGEMAFYMCRRLQTIEIPAGVTEICYSTFADCYNLEEVILPETVTTISYNAFAYIEGLRSIVSPASVTQIKPLAFDGTGLETVVFAGDRPKMDASFGDSKAAAFYRADAKGWEDIAMGNLKWYDCVVPQITSQPVNATADEGKDAAVTVRAYGQRLSFQWYYAKPGSNKFAPVGGDSITLAVTMNKETSGGKAYCVITDVVGQTTQTDTVTLRITPKLTGIRISQLPYTVEYSLRQQLRTRGLIVLATYSDGSEEVITDYAVRGFDPMVAGKQAVTVAYKDFTAKFEVTVDQGKTNFTDPDQQVEINAPAGALNSNTQLHAEKLMLEDTPAILNGHECVAFELTLEQDGQKVQPAAPVEVWLPLPVEIQAKSCKVYYLPGDGTAVDMQAKYKDGGMLFLTEHFSCYVLAEQTGVQVSGKLTGATGGQPVVVSLLSGGEVLESKAFTDSYLFENLVPGTYAIEAGGRVYALQVADKDLTQDIALLTPGDVDGNDAVDVDDAIYLLQHVLMPDLFQIAQPADYNGSGAVDVDDAIYLLQHVLMPELFPLK